MRKQKPMWLLAFVMIFSSLLPPACAAQSDEYALYIPAVEQAISEQAYRSSPGKGLLFDMDGDGKDELLLYYEYFKKRDFDNMDVPIFGYSVFDTESGCLDTKVSKKDLCVDVAGNGGYVALVNYQGKLALLTTVSVGSYFAGESSVKGELYDAKTMKNLVNTGAITEWDSAGNEHESYTINGQSCSYEAYARLQNEITYLHTLGGYSNAAENDPSVMKLPELLNFLEEATGSNTDFADVRISDWYYDAVQYVNKKGLLTGTTNMNFSPNQVANRGMIATVLWRMAGSPAVSAGTAFTDVPSTAYYSRAAVWASANGIIIGYPDGRFRPNDAVTREQLAVMLYRYAGKPNTEGILLFGDVNQVSSYAKAAVLWANKEGVISGRQEGHRKLIDPQGTATRAETAAMLMRFCEAGHQSPVIKNEPVNISTMYDDFLKSGAYLAYTADWWCVPNEFALLDINQDGTEEMIVQGKDGTGFYYFAVFGYNTSKGKIEKLLLPSTESVEANCCYGGLEYSGKYQSLVFTGLRPMEGSTSYKYYYLKDSVFKVIFGVGENMRDDGSTYKCIFEETPREITAEELWAYTEETKAIVFQPLP